METCDIFPRALVTAARTFADRPKVVGEVLVALCGPFGSVAPKSFSDVQKYILDACNEELVELRQKRDEKRMVWAERKRKSRAKKEVA